MHRQRGATLLVTLIFLVLMTLAAMVAFNTGRSSQAIVGNTQARAQAESVARQTLEDVITNTYFVDNPTSPLGTTNTKTFDVNHDGVADITVKVGQSGSTTNPRPCLRAFQLVAVDPSDPGSTGCTLGEQQTFGIEGAQSSSSTQCADMLWDVTAVATDLATSASVTAVEGIRIRDSALKTTLTSTYCP